MTVSFPVTVELGSPAPPALTFEVIAPIDLSLIFRPMGLLPGVSGVEEQSGPWSAVGATRTPRLTDGSTAREILIEWTPPHSFAYEVRDFTNPTLRSLVARVRGEWTMTPDRDRCLVRWSYAFEPRKGRAAIVRLLLVPLWRPYMRRTLQRAIGEVRRRTTA
jgi:Polyketide cyclase / dehydrase and lipid transport